jgi:hypothetical protein
MSSPTYSKHSISDLPLGGIDIPPPPYTEVLLLAKTGLIPSSKFRNIYSLADPLYKASSPTYTKHYISDLPLGGIGIPPPPRTYTEVLLPYVLHFSFVAIVILMCIHVGNVIYSDFLNLF